MNPITCVFFLALVGHLVTALETIKTSPMSDTTNFPFIPYGASATSGPYTITSGLYKNSTSDWALNIQKRNASGYYTQIAQLAPIPGSIMVATNGKWFAASFMENGTAVVFQVVDNAISNIFYIKERDAVVKVLSDDSLLFISDGNVTTYNYLTDGQWSVVDQSALTNFQLLSYLGLIHVTDTTIAYVGTDKVAYMYVRSDKSWQLRYSIPLNGTTGLYNMAWNGGDTFIISGMETSGGGAISLYQLSGNSWNFVHNFTAEDLEIKPMGYLGLNMALLDNDTFVFSAPLDGVVSAYVGGSAFVLQRKSGTWSVTVRLESSQTDIYALGIGYNDLDILLYSCNVIKTGVEPYAECTQQVLARCFSAPIDVTCKDVKLDSCASLSSVDFSTLYTINNPLCGNTDVNMKSLSADSETIKLALEFTRSFADSVTCDAQVTCSNLVKLVSSAGQQLVNVFLVLFAITTSLLI